MHLLFTPAFVALVSLASALPGKAQYAYVAVAEPLALSANTAGAEDAPKASTYKLVHGVVQGQQGTLAGATVWLHGTKTIVVTNAEGEFELRVPTDAQVVELTCGYGGLQEETVRLAPTQSLGSVYLLRSKSANNQAAAAE